MSSSKKRAEPTSLKSPHYAYRDQPKRPNALVEFTSDLRGTWRTGKRNLLPVLAAGVAFFCLFSLCPFLILCSMGSHYLLGMNGFANVSGEFGTFLGVMLPSAEAWVSESLLTVLKQNVVGNILTLVLLCWSTYSLFSCLHVVFTKISVRGRQRSAFWTNFVCVGCFVIVSWASILLFLLSTTNVQVLKTIYSPYLDDFSLQMVGYLATSGALACAFSSLIFLFKFMPTQTISLHYAVRSSFLFMALFLGGREVFQVYASYYRVMNQNVYGGFLGFIMVTVWIYYLSHSFLFAAQYAIYMEEKNRHHR